MRDGHFRDEYPTLVDLVVDEVDTVEVREFFCPKHGFGARGPVIEGLRCDCHEEDRP